MEKGESRGLSIFNRLLLTFLGVIIIILGILSFVFYGFSRRSIEKQTQERISQQFESVSYQFRHELGEILLRDMKILASNPTLDEYMMSSEMNLDINARALERLFTQSIHYTKNYQSIYFVDYTGKEKVRVDRTGRIKEYRDLSGSKLFTQIESGAAGSFSIEGPFKDKDGKVFFSIGISKVDADIGQFGGAVFIDYSLEDSLGRLNNIQILGENPVWVFASSWQALKQPVKKEAIFDPGAYFSKGVQEDPKLTVLDNGMFIYQDLSVIPGKPLLRIAISIPSSLLLKDIKTVLKFLFIVFFLSIIIISSIAYGLSRYLTSPIIELADAAKRLSKGELSTRVKVKTTGEVQMLIDSFNQMAQDLNKTTVSKDYMDNIIKSMTDTLIVVSPEGRIISSNNAACRLLGYEEKELVDQPIEIILGEELLFRGSEFENFLRKNPIHNIETTYMTKEGKKIPVLFSASFMSHTDDKPRDIVCVAQDITERKHSEETLKSSYNTLRTILDSLPYSVLIIGRDKNIQHANQAALALMGYESEEELIGMICNKTLCTAEEGNCPIIDLNGVVDSSEKILITKDGRHVPILKTVVPVTLDKGEVLLEAFIDISERKYAEEEIRYLAFYDSLTQLPNRSLFRELLKRTFSYAERYDQMFALLYIDLDNFKRINDTLGHHIGDQLLKVITESLLKSIRNSDYVARSEEEEIIDTVSRLGGDEFIILLHRLSDVQDAGIVAGRLLKDISRPFVLSGHNIYMTASIGISIFPFDGKDSDTLLKNSDMAMYHAKEKGKNNFQFYTESMNKTAFERLELENELRIGLEREEFLLYYQPKLDITRKKIVGMEALIRWKHQNKGLISPMQFIPIAEETGLIIQIGEWVLRTACIQNNVLQEEGFPPISVAVNLSSRQFEQENLIDIVKRALYDSGLDPRYLELEITESMIMKKPESAFATLNELKSMGIHISVDDFGTGYSSLSYLRQIPLNSLKIDRSFVKDIPENQDAIAIVKAIIALAHNLQLSVTAEGVETEKQLAFLLEHGCDEMQGYLWSPPLPFEKIKKLLDEKKQKTIFD
ncbi:MAG: EAL domain-containing protein [Nitrospirota bacterium]